MLNQETMRNDASISVNEHVSANFSNRNLPTNFVNFARVREY